MHFILAVLCLAFALTAVVARKTYNYLPARELKRQAQKGDEQAIQLYKAVAYGGSLRALLWIVIVLASAEGVVLLTASSPWWLSLLTVAALLWAAFSWLPSSRITPWGARITILITPVIVWLLSRLHPLLSRGAERLEKRSAPAHTGLFDRSDIQDLIERQALQSDSRLSIEELAIVQRALAFGDYLVRDILISRQQVPTVLATDILGPILIDELHKAGSPFVLVLDEPKGTIVGSLELQHLGLHSSGPIQDQLKGSVYYLHESDTLREALHAFFVTNCPLFVVVNSFEEYVGIVTIEAVLRQLLGHVPGEDFEQYTDLPTVAARHPKPEKAAKSSKVIKKADVEPSEVVE